MSLLDSMTTGPDSTGTMPLPQFATVMRGYDRGQVDDYLSRVNAALRDAQQQAEDAESDLADAQALNDELRQAGDPSEGPSPGQPYEGLGERVQGMLKLAAEEADAIRRQAQTEAAAMVAEAQRRREQEVQLAEAELAEVASRRSAVVTELCKVQDALATLGLQQPADAGVLPPALSTEDGRQGATADDEEAKEAASDDPDRTTVVAPAPDQPTDRVGGIDGNFGR